MSSNCRAGSKNQSYSWLNAPARIASTTPSRVSLAIVQRRRPMPWVHAYLKVPVSSSLASTAGPVKAPSRAGTRLIRMAMVFDIGQSVALKEWFFAPQAVWQLIRAV